MKGQQRQGVRTSPRWKEVGGREEEGKKEKKDGPSSSSSSISEEKAWPSVVIGLTNKEKEEDFMAIEGSKPPQRPKKRSKSLQSTLNFVSPGSWLCDLTLDRYEVREKKISKKFSYSGYLESWLPIYILVFVTALGFWSQCLFQRPKGLKAMGNMEADWE